MAEQTVQDAAEQVAARVGKVQVEQGNAIGDLNWGTPTEEQKAAWKAKYGENMIKTASFAGPVPGTKIPVMTFYFRCVNRKQYREIMFDLGLTPEQREDKLCQDLVLWPGGINFGVHFGDESPKAGTPTMLLETILNASGFQNALEVGNV